MKKILIKGVRGYQKNVSPLFPPSCRFYPTCSTYMIQAIETHGAAKGTLMGTAEVACASIKNALSLTKKYDKELIEKIYLDEKPQCG